MNRSLSVLFVGLALAGFASIGPITERVKETGLDKQVRTVQRWIEETCPQKDYLTCLQSETVSPAVVGDMAIVHMGRYFGDDALNPFSSNDKHDICVALDRTDDGNLYLVIPSFDDEPTCQKFARRAWPNSDGVDNRCADDGSEWGKHIRIRLNKGD